MPPLAAPFLALQSKRTLKIPKNERYRGPLNSFGSVIMPQPLD